MNRQETVTRAGAFKKMGMEALVNAAEAAGFSMVSPEGAGSSEKAGTAPDAAAAPASRYERARLHMRGAWLKVLGR